MAGIDHYMVEFEDAAGTAFANEEHLGSLAEAETLAAAKSAEIESGAYVVAYEREALPGFFKAVGHIAFFHGTKDHTEGVVA